MAELVDCSHGMPSRASCFECMEEGPVARPDVWWKVGLPFVAVYEGTCVGCDATAIKVGQRVQRWDRGPQRTAYLHVGCTP